MRRIFAPRAESVVFTVTGLDHEQADAKALDMSSTALPVPEDTSFLGAHVRDGGTSFGLWAPRATRVELALVDEDRNQTNCDLTRDDNGAWTVFVPGVGAEQRYGFRAHGPWDPQPALASIPQSCSSTRTPARLPEVDYSGPILDHTIDSNYVPTPGTRLPPCRSVLWCPTHPRLGRSIGGGRCRRR